MTQMKRSLKKRLSVLALTCICLGAQPAVAYAATESGNAIDAGIYGLDYNRYEVLAQKGDSIESFVPRESTSENGEFIVIEREKKSLSTSPVDISIVDSVTDRTYPGAIQLANQAFVENRPDLLVAERKPLNISIDLPGMGYDNAVTVENPTYAGVSGAVDTLIDKWSAENSDTHTLPARTQYSESMVYSKSQIEAALNVNAKVLNTSLGIDFNAVSSGEKNVMVAAYKQIFYTVSSEMPPRPSELFADSVTFEELKQKGVSAQAPPLMVSNVAYGRTVYVKLETTSKNKEVQSAFKALLKNGNVDANAVYKEIIENSSFTAVVLGGDAAAHNKVITKDFDEIKEVLKENATFSLKNPAYPISYTSVFLKDNSVAAVQNRTEYVETTATSYKKGRINLNHSGGYVAQFAITWDEFNYDANGNEVVTPRAWSGNWSDRTAPFSTVIPLEPNTRNIRIFARECTGLAWEWWRTVLDEHHVPMGAEINVTVSGTTLNPYGNVEIK